MSEFKYSEKQCEDFYQKLRKTFEKPFTEEEKVKAKKFIPVAAQEIINYTYFLPDIMYLTINLIFDKNIPLDKKTGLIIGATYLINPIDIIPDFIPVAGYIDDFIIVTYFLNKFFDSDDEYISLAIDKYWLGNENLLNLLLKINNNLKKIWNILGIDDIIDKPNQKVAKVISVAWNKYKKDHNDD